MSVNTTQQITRSAHDGGAWVAQTVRRVQAEYDEMPGLCLTSAQAARLLGLEHHECVGLLGGLVDVGFLRCTPAGYVRA